LLLRTIMEIPLQPMTLSILGSYQTPPRHAQLLSTVSQLSMQTDIAQQDTCPCRHIGKNILIGASHRIAGTLCHRQRTKYLTVVTYCNYRIPWKASNTISHSGNR
jgi:hypothetical protein